MFESRVGCVAAVEHATEALAALPETLHRLPSADLGGVLERLDALAARVDAARVLLTGEAQTRGVVAESTCASTTDWVAAHAKSLEPGEAHRVALVARACAAPGNEPLAAAVRQARVSTRCAAVALREVARVEPFLPESARGEALGWFLSVAADAGPRQLRRLGTWLVGRFSGDALQVSQDRLRRLNAMSRTALGNGMTRYLLDLDPDAAAALDAVIDPLSRPQPCAETGAADTRLAPQRRAEALVEACRRAAAAGGDAPATTKAQVVVTIDYDALRQRVGAGTTLTGELLGAETVRALACDATLIPMVLAAPSAPLDVGRAKRLVTPGMLAALWVRDQGCTFPGCTRPPTWCHAHHVRHWVDGGATSLANSALLCGRHHTIVHQRDLTATVTDTGVTWHT